MNIKKVPDERVGEEICVWIIPNTNDSLSADEVRDFCKGNISQFKIPRFIKFVERFPINANGKVMKNQMKDEAVLEYKL